MVSQAQGVMRGHKGAEGLAGCLQTKFEHWREGDRAETESYRTGGPLDLAEGQERPL